MAIDDAIHPGVFEVAILRLPEAPGGFAHADDVDAGLLHERDIFFETIAGHVLS